MLRSQPPVRSSVSRLLAAVLLAGGGAVAQEPGPDRPAEAAEPERAPFSIAEVLDAARPAGLLRRDIWARAEESGDDAVFLVQGDRAPFRWRLSPRGGNPLSILSIEDEGATFEPLHGAYIKPLEDKLHRSHFEVAEGTALVRYLEGLEVSWSARGRTMTVEVSGGYAAELGLGGLQPILPAGATARVLQVPYNDHGAVAVVRLADGRMRFLSAWFDPVLSNATQLKIRRPGGRGADNELFYSQAAQYRPNTAGELRVLRERIWITWSDRLLDVLPSQVRPASPARDWAGDRYYIDYHHTPFDDAARDLRLLHAAGVRDLVIWMRQWQRDGYDTGYPTQVLPPREQWGGLLGLRDVRRAAAEADWDFGLGHNWVFNTERLEGASALSSDGTEVYFDGGAVRLKPAAAVALVEKIERSFHEGFLTRGTYSDSITATYPTVDLDAASDGWGLVRTTLEAWGQVLGVLREVHGAPVAGEGSLRFGNLHWAGVVDVTTGMPGMVTESTDLEALGVNVPVVPHYRLRRLHPLHVHAGFGSPSVFLHPDRNYSDATYVPTDRDGVLSLASLYGLAGYSWWWNRATVGDVARDWWSTFATRAHLARPDMVLADVEYVDSRGRWVALEGLLAQGRIPHMGDARVRSTWVDGTRVWVNLTPLPWEVEVEADRTALLPAMGRLVVAPELESGLVIVDGRTVEYARTATTLFVDARGGQARMDGVEVAGAVALRFEEPGLLEVIPIPEYVNAIDAERNERRVRTTRIHLDGQWLDDLLGPGRLDLRGRGLVAETNRVEGVGRFELEREDDGSLVIGAERWESIGASALLITAAPDEPN